MAIAPKLKLKAIPRNFFDKAMQAVQRANKKNLSHLGGWLRNSARWSIKNSTRAQRKAAGNVEVYSKPGDPPFNKTGILRRCIEYDYDNKTDSVVVGAKKLPSKRGMVPQALEYSGNVITNVWNGPKWIQLSGGLWVRNPNSMKHQEVRHIQERPYMRPALMRARQTNLFKRYWHDSLRPLTL